MAKLRKQGVSDYRQISGFATISHTPAGAIERITDHGKQGNSANGAEKGAAKIRRSVT